MSRGLLLDTHVFLWLAQDPPKLMDDVRLRLENGREPLFLSVVCVFEACIKAALGKLDLPVAIAADPRRGFEEAAAASDMRVLPIELAHAARTRDLPLHHKDPFDRLLVGQALEEDLTLVTHDRTLGLYKGVDFLWA